MGEVINLDGLPILDVNSVLQMLIDGTLNPDDLIESLVDYVELWAIGELDDAEIEKLITEAMWVKHQNQYLEALS